MTVAADQIQILDFTPAANSPRLGNAARRADLLRYLDTCRYVLVTRNRMVDVVSPKQTPTVPNGFTTNGSLLIPLEVAFYLRRYDIAPPAALIEQAVQHQFVVPEVSDERLRQVADALFADTQARINS